MSASLTNGKLVGALEASNLVLKDICLPPSITSFLTPRECDIVQLICQGLSNKEIACAMDVAYSTVKNHITSVMEKLGLEHRTQIAVFAMALAARNCKCHAQPEGICSAVQYLFPIDSKPPGQYGVTTQIDCLEST